ncbi:MAG: hypothetical protein AB8B99_19310 [Phormidesmis sp.]
MFIRLMQATAITLALYGLLGLNDLQTMRADGETIEVAVEPPEVLVALKEALTKRD